jgi:CHAT domain-containing protein
LQQANAVDGKGLRIQVLNNLGLLYTQMGQKDKALSHLQQALSIAQGGGMSTVETLINLGSYYKEFKQYSQAIEYYEQALAWAKKNSDRLNQVKALNALGETFLEMQKLPQAIASLSKGVSAFESLRPGLRDEQKVSLFETQSYAYSLLQKALVMKGDTIAALDIAERGRARAFAEQLAMRLSTSTQPAINPKPPSLQEIKATAKNLNATLVTYSTIQDAKQQENELFIWVVNPQGEIKFKSQNIKTLKFEDIAVETGSRNRGITNLVRQTRQSILKRGSSLNNSPYLQKSYELLIQPIADSLPKQANAKIIFIPQGSLFLVPFAALQDSQNKYLIEKYTISTAPSIQTLSLTAQLKKPATSQQPLIIGNPFPMPKELSPLPGAETEALAIAKLLNIKALTKAEATEAIVLEKMPQANIIHLATHGLFDEKQGLQSALAFVPSAGNNGMLTALEIFDMKLKADIAVLSACDTGRGQITGDGVIGLSRAFMAAGVPTVVMSLWAVPDEATAALMKEFYTQKQNKTDKAIALRQAMLATMKKYPESENWAAFTIVGQP